MLKYELTQEQFNLIFDQLRGYFKKYIPLEVSGEIQTREYLDAETLYWKWHQAHLQQFLNEAFWDGYEMANGNPSQIRKAKHEYFTTLSPKPSKELQNALT